VTGMTHS